VAGSIWFDLIIVASRTHGFEYGNSIATFSPKLHKKKTQGR